MDDSSVGEETMIQYNFEIENNLGILAEQSKNGIKFEEQNYEVMEE